MTKLLQILIPPLMGVGVILLAMHIESLFHPEYEKSGLDEVAEFFWWMFVVPTVTLVCVLFQILVVNFFKKEFVDGTKRKTLSYILLTLGFCVILGGLIGAMSWRRALGSDDLMLTMLVSLTLQLMYWVPNMLGVAIIDRILGRAQINKR